MITNYLNGSNRLLPLAYADTRFTSADTLSEVTHPTNHVFNTYIYEKGLLVIFLLQNESSIKSNVS